MHLGRQMSGPFTGDDGKSSNATEKPSSDESQMVGARAAKGVCD